MLIQIVRVGGGGWRWSMTYVVSVRVDIAATSDARALVVRFARILFWVVRVFTLIGLNLAVVVFVFTVVCVTVAIINEALSRLFARVFGGGVVVVFVALSSFLPFAITIAPSIIFLAFSICIILGVVSGIIPASIAAKMNPVEAIRTK